MSRVRGQADRCCAEASDLEGQRPGGDKVSPVNGLAEGNDCVADDGPLLSAVLAPPSRSTEQEREIGGVKTCEDAVCFDIRCGRFYDDRSVGHCGLESFPIGLARARSALEFPRDGSPCFMIPGWANVPDLAICRVQGVLEMAPCGIPACLHGSLARPPSGLELSRLASPRLVSHEILGPGLARSAPASC